MILADKIIKLRKQYGWSQEDLAEKVNVSRQSVSKWESTSSIPDLNKIILMAEIFGVTTDFLLKDDIEVIDQMGEGLEEHHRKVSLEEANAYVTRKIKFSKYVSIGVLLSILSIVPLFFLLGFRDFGFITLSSNAAVATGIVAIFLMISAAVSLFIKGSQYDDENDDLKRNTFELEYGVSGIIKDKLSRYRNTYHRRVSLGVMLFLLSVVPLITVSIMTASGQYTLALLIVMMLMIGAGLVLIIPASIKHDAYLFLVQEGQFSPERRKSNKRAERFGAFYWPLITAFYLGWSLWTMRWGITWIVWPIAGIIFVSLLGLFAMFDHED